MSIVKHLDSLERKCQPKQLIIGPKYIYEHCIIDLYDDCEYQYVMQ